MPTTRASKPKIERAPASGQGACGGHSLGLGDVEENDVAQFRHRTSARSRPTFPAPMIVIFARFIISIFLLKLHERFPPVSTGITIVGPCAVRQEPAATGRLDSTAICGARRTRRSLVRRALAGGLAEPIPRSPTFQRGVATRRVAQTRDPPFEPAEHQATRRRDAQKQDRSDQAFGGAAGRPPTRMPHGGVAQSAGQAAARPSPRWPASRCDRPRS